MSVRYLEIRQSFSGCEELGTLQIKQMHILLVSFSLFVLHTTCAK